MKYTKYRVILIHIQKVIKIETECERGIDAKKRYFLLPANVGLGRKKEEFIAVRAEHTMFSIAFLPAFLSGCITSNIKEIP